MTEKDVVQPDLTTMRVSERAAWFYQQLCKLPGEIVEQQHSRGGPTGRWLVLTANNMIDLLEAIGPGLSASQYTIVNNYLGASHDGLRLRDSITLGGGLFKHFILLPDESAEAPMDETATEAPGLAETPETISRVVQTGPDSEPKPDEDAETSEDTDGLEDDAELAAHAVQVVRELEQRVARLEAENSDLKLMNAQLKQENDALHASIAGRSAAMAELRKVVRRLSK